jgi:hypothetical protein
MMDARRAMRWIARGLLAIGLFGASHSSVALGERKGTVTRGASTTAGTAIPLQVAYSRMADGLHLAEQLSLWQPGMSRQVYTGFEEKFGLDETTNELLKRFAQTRRKIEEKAAKTKPEATFDAPFGKEGLFPAGSQNVVEQFWSTVMSTNTPDELIVSLAGMLEPGDAETVSALFSKLMVPLGELAAGRKGYQSEIDLLTKALNKGEVPRLLSNLRTWLGVDLTKAEFSLSVVWTPAGAPIETFSVGDRIVLALPEGTVPGPAVVAMVVRETARRMLSRLPAVQKQLFTARFVEKNGVQPEAFWLVEGLLDALGMELIERLNVSGQREVLNWPHGDQQKKLALRLTRVIRAALDGSGKFDMDYTTQVADITFEIFPPRPRDFMFGSMVIAEEATLEPVKSQMMRWTIWKFPPSKKFNFSKKLDTYPGRSVLLVLTPGDLGSLPAQFKGQPDLLAGLRQAKNSIAGKKAVLLTVPRAKRGYFFILVATSSEAMKTLTKEFLELDSIPETPVEVQ